MPVFLADGYVATAATTTVVRTPIPVPSTSDVFTTPITPPAPHTPGVFFADGYVMTLSITTVVGSDTVEPVLPDGTTILGIPASSPSSRQPPPPFVPATSGDVYRPGLSTT